MQYDSAQQKEYAFLKENCILALYGSYKELVCL